MTTSTFTRSEALPNFSVEHLRIVKDQLPFRFARLPASIFHFTELE